MLKFTIVTAALLSVLGVSARAGEHHVARDGNTKPSAALVKLLEQAIDRGAPLYDRGSPSACLAVYELTARTAVTLGNGTVSEADRESLEKGLAEAGRERDVRKGAWALRRAFDEVIERSREANPVVVSEASLPAGFPAPGPVGKVVVKEYPQYRMARSESGRMAFWKLFNHIKSNDIAMTAPVEMTMTPRRGGGLSMSRMAFLYATPGLGKIGAQGDVEVVDVEGMRVLSIGIMGRLDAETVRQAREAIEKTVGAGQVWERAGDWRVMGYNSPMVPEAKRFHELQLPVRLAVDG